MHTNSMCSICESYHTLYCFVIVYPVFYRLMNSTFIQCRAMDRLRRGTGPVVFFIDRAAVESEEDFAYTDDPEVFSVTPNDIIKRCY